MQSRVDGHCLPESLWRAAVTPPAVQARMRHGGNTAFARYMRSCGMPEALQTGGAEAIREKYNTESAAAYRAHLASVARGEPSELQPVPYAPPPPPKPRERPMSGCGPRADASSMQARACLTSLAQLRGVSSMHAFVNANARFNGGRARARSLARSRSRIKCGILSRSRARLLRCACAL
eukprot:5729997-Pleurochrysis_carterae.AAC.2